MNYTESYSKFLNKFLTLKRKLKVVFDCSNGTTGIILKELLRDPSLRSGRLSAVLINDKPDGNFPAHGPNPMGEGAMNDLSKAVVHHKADLGVIFDADGDRVFFVDDLGRPIIPDAAIYFLAKNFSGPVILTVNIGPLVRGLLKKDKRKVIDSRIGHYFIKKTIRQKKINFAAERSGHYYFKKFFYADSGIFSAIQFINSVSKLKTKPSDFINSIPYYYSSGELNFEAGDKAQIIKKVEQSYKKDASSISKLDGLTVNLKNGAWFNLRSSNTEDLIRLNLESESPAVFKSELDRLNKLL